MLAGPTTHRSNHGYNPPRDAPAPIAGLGWGRESHFFELNRKGQSREYTIHSTRSASMLQQHRQRLLEIFLQSCKTHLKNFILLLHRDAGSHFMAHLLLPCQSSDETEQVGICCFHINKFWGRDGVVNLPGNSSHRTVLTV